MGIFDGFLSLGRSINKFKGTDKVDTQEGAVSDFLPELTLSMSDDQLKALAKDWKKEWDNSPVKALWLKHCDENENYWLGNQYAKIEIEQSRPQVDNAIFEALETFLPQATRRNPEPLVIPEQQIESDADALKYASAIKGKLSNILDKIKFRLRMKKVARHWALYLIGVGKVGWDLENDIPTMRAVRGKRIIFDPTATNDEDGYSGRFLGEYRKMEASILLKMIKDEGIVTKIKKAIDNQLGTELQFIEWWTPQYTFWEMDNEILLSKKNPHFNYDKEIPGETTVGDDGIEMPGETQKVPQFNHFKTPRIPYVFLTIFNIGKQPIDETSLIGQNLSTQDRINKMDRQIDKNIDKMNGGMVISQERSGLDKEGAKLAEKALRKGGAVIIPNGSPRDAIDTYQSPGLPADVFNNRADSRARLRDVFGTTGISPSGIENEDTVGGKVIVKGLDTDRIGGGITEYLEQFADDCLNWFLQMLYVYDEEFISIEKPFPMVVSVKEGSLLPKDATTLANQAISLSQAGKLSLIDLYKALERPNPEELAANMWLEVNAPEVLYGNDPRVRQVLIQQGKMQPEQTDTSTEGSDAELAAAAAGNGAPAVPTNADGSSLPTGAVAQ
jgi:hypothetical protein